jgi:hypothetical protein
MSRTGTLTVTRHREPFTILTRRIGGDNRRMSGERFFGAGMAVVDLILSFSLPVTRRSRDKLRMRRELERGNTPCVSSVNLKLTDRPSA